MKFHPASPIALAIGCVTLFAVVLLALIYAPLSVYLIPAGCHLLAAGGLGYWLWRSWVHIAWQAALPHLAIPMTCFGQSFINGYEPDLGMFWWIGWAVGLSLAGAGLGALARAQILRRSRPGRSPDIPPPRA